MDAFHNVQFPPAISFGATGGPAQANDIVLMASGYEKRNARVSAPRRRYDAGTGVRSLEDLYEILAFFEARRGSLHAFRFRDPFDMKSCAPDETTSPLDQVLGTGNGSNDTFQVAKTYGSGAYSVRRDIVLPAWATIKVAVGGVLKTPGTHYSFGGIGFVTFAPAAVPAPGQAVTAGFEFDVPVRFDTEHLSLSLTTFRAGQIPTIPLVEVRL